MDIEIICIFITIVFQLKQSWKFLSRFNSHGKILESIYMANKQILKALGMWITLHFTLYLSGRFLLLSLLTILILLLWYKHLTWHNLTTKPYHFIVTFEGCNIISLKVFFMCTLETLFSNAVILRLRCLEALALH